MKNQSNEVSHLISLPQGGGALSGIGEKFSPDLQSGTGNFTAPIALPPGRNGLQHELNLVYSSGNGNGPFGLGWSLSIPGDSHKAMTAWSASMVHSSRRCANTAFRLTTIKQYGEIHAILEKIS